MEKPSGALTAPVRHDDSKDQFTLSVVPLSYGAGWSLRYLPRLSKSHNGART